MKAKVVTNALNRAHQYIEVGADGPFWDAIEVTLDQARAIRAALNEHERLEAAAARAGADCAADAAGSAR